MVETVFKVAIIGIVVSLVIGLLGTVFFEWSLDTSPYLQGVTSFLSIIYYVLPISKLSPLIIIFLSTMAFRIVISVITTIWNLIPLG